MTLGQWALVFLIFFAVACFLRYLVRLALNGMPLKKAWKMVFFGSHVQDRGSIENETAHESPKGDQDDKGGDSAQNDRKASCAAEKEIAEALAYLIRHALPNAVVLTGYYEETVDVPGWDVSIDYNGKGYIIFVNKVIGLRVFVRVSEEDYHEFKGPAGSESEVELKLQQMITDLRQPAAVAPESVTEQKDGVG